MTLQLGPHFYTFIPASIPGKAVLLLLHGTGGDENDLVPLGQIMMPGAAIISPRGNDVENGMARFFRRLASGVFDQQDLVARTHELAQFVELALVEHDLTTSEIVAVGFSNGANVAASLLMLHPGLLTAAALLHGMMPLDDVPAVDLSGTRVFVAGGKIDTLITLAQSQALEQVLLKANAAVTAYWSDDGHTITPGEFAAVKVWMN